MSKDIAILGVGMHRDQHAAAGRAFAPRPLAGEGRAVRGAGGGVRAGA